MKDFELKPFPGEDEVSYIKRKAYYHRLLKPRLAYGRDCLDNKLGNTTPINVNQREEIDAFWAPYLTPEQRDKFIDYRYYDVYNNVLREGEKLCEYMPEDFYALFIDEYFGNPQHSFPTDDKNLYDLYYHDIKRPRTIFRKVSGLLLDEKYDEITLDDVLAMSREQGEVIVKPTRFTRSGRGLLFWDSCRNDEKELKDYLQSSGDVVCQEVVKQHPELSRLNASSLNTIRIMTMMLHGKVHVLSSCIRMGIAGSKVDNFTNGGIGSGIKPNGQLKNEAYDYQANRYDKHPSGTIFESVTIPNFDECIEMVTYLAKRISIMSRLVSWDLAIDESGHPLIIEMNFAGGLDIHQLCNGPIYREMTHEVLGEVFKNAYTLNAILKSMQ